MVDDDDFTKFIKTSPLRNYAAPYYGSEEWDKPEFTALWWVYTNLVANCRQITPPSDFGFHYKFVVPYWIGPCNRSDKIRCSCCYRYFVHGGRDNVDAEGLFPPPPPDVTTKFLQVAAGAWTVC